MQHEEEEEEEEVEEEEKEKDGCPWVESMTSQDSALQNSTIFTFPTVAAMKTRPCFPNSGSNVNQQDEDTHSESTACFSFDHEEEFKEHDGSDGSDEEAKEDDGEAVGVRHMTAIDCRRSPPSSPVQCVTPVRVSCAASSVERGKEVAYMSLSSDQRREESSRSTRQSRARRHLQRLKEHFNDLKCEFEEEYGEGEVVRLLRAY